MKRGAKMDLPAARNRNQMKEERIMKRCLFSLIAVLAIGHAAAQEYRAGSLRIADAHARPTVPGQTSGAVYFSLDNTGKSGDKLLAISSPAAQSTELHSMQMDGNIMRMREVGELELKPAAHIAMQPGDGYHVMLIGLKQPLTPGEKIPLSLRFEKAGKVAIEATVDNR
jgi:periplasmic copper chaperone A